MALSDSAGVGSALPSQAGVTSGYALTTDGTTASWSSVGTGTLSGFSTFGSTPNANGGSVSSTNIVLQPADATHPGGVSTGAQSFGGVKTFSSVPVAAGLTAPATTALTYTSNVADGAGAVCHIFDTGTLVSTSGAKWLSFRTNGSEQAFFGVVSGANTLSLPGQVITGKLSVTSGAPSIIQTTADTTLYLYGNKNNGATAENCVVDTQAAYTTAGAAPLVVKANGAKVMAVETNATVFGIYLKSPDGTAYLATIANGGTWNIAAAP